MTASEFESLFRDWYQPLCRYVRHLSGSNHIAEDLVQDVFVRLWDRQPDLGSSGAWKAYLYKSVSNAYLNLAQRQMSRQVSMDGMTQEPFHENNPEQILNESEIQILYDLALAKLPPACRQVFCLRRHEKLSYKEIASLLGISEKTVENQMSQAIRLLKASLGPVLIIFFALMVSLLKSFLDFFFN
jgi:RNA polymerase sigma-70 factor (ECF subfamily)